MIGRGGHRASAGSAARLRVVAFLLTTLTLSAPNSPAADGVFYKGATGPGHGLRIVFLAGDEEYRSEEGLPMLAKILAVRHGFDCTVLFSINPATGDIDPDCQTNLPGIQALDSADLCVMQLRFREWPDKDMKHFVDYLNAGKPIIALRTSTHAFQYSRNKHSPYAKYDWSSSQWPGGFGRQVLGETWVSHHGDHGGESTRGVLNPVFKDQPILRGVTDLWWPSDVYTVTHLPSDAQVLAWGQVLSGMKPDDPPVTGPKNNPLMPLVWVREFKGDEGKTSKIVTTTGGAAVDLQNEELRRLLVNACYWTLGLGDKISAHADVAYVDDYQPSFFDFGKYKRGVKPSDLKIKSAPEEP
jgi:Trehalose utilisation